MLKHLLYISLFLTHLCYGQISLKGYAPSYVGQTIEIYGIEDYFSGKEHVIASATVQPDSTFSFTLDIPSTRKILIKSNNNKGFLYVQPNGKYNVFFPDRDRYDPYRPNGNSVEIAFYQLDSTDINYKILGFQRWIDHFVGNNYYYKNAKPLEFAEA